MFKILSRPTRTARRMSSGPRRLMERVFLVVGGLMIGLLLAETAATYWRMAKHGSAKRGVLVETRRSQKPTVDEEQRYKGTVLHPLFGYIFDPKRQGVNNFGFKTEYDISLSDQGYVIQDQIERDLLVVGIFGGSFAYLTGELSDDLEQKLAKIFPESTPIVLNMAIVGQAVPQSVFVYLYFRELFDIVVYIDGLNELWNYSENNRAGVPPEYAKAAHYRYKISRQELTPRTFENTARLLATQRKMDEVTALSLHPVLRNFIVVHYAWNWRVNLLSRKIAETSLAIKNEYSEGDQFFKMSEDEILEFAVQQWRAYHDLVHRVAAQQGALSIHLLQPNPFVPQSKQMTPEEQSLVTQSYPIEPYVVHGYPKLRQAIPMLETQGIVADDLTDIYQDVAESIWIDAAHANRRGCQLVIDRLVSKIQHASQMNPLPGNSSP